MSTKFRKSLSHHSSHESLSERPSFDMSRQVKAVERQLFQERVYKTWINSKLINNSNPLRITNLCEDFKTGRNLLILLEVLTGKTLKPVKGNMRLHHLNNINLALDVLKDYQVKLINIHNYNIADGEQLSTMGLIWNVMYRFQVIEALKGFSSQNVEKALLKWCQELMETYTGSDAKSFQPKQWKDGYAFNSLIHAHVPELFDFSSLSALDDHGRLENAFHHAKETFNVDAMFEPNDFVNDFVDNKSIVIYISSLYAKLKDHVPASKQGNKEIVKKVEFAITEESKFLYGKQDSTLLEALQNPTLKDLKKRYKGYNNFFKELEEAICRIDSIETDLTVIMDLSDVSRLDKDRLQAMYSKLQVNLKTLESNAKVAHNAVQTKLVQHLKEQLNQVSGLVLRLRGDEANIVKALESANCTLSKLNEKHELCEKTTEVLVQMKPLVKLLHDLSEQLANDDTINEDVCATFHPMAVSALSDFDELVNSLQNLQQRTAKEIEGKEFNAMLSRWLSRLHLVLTWLEQTKKFYTENIVNDSNEEMLESELVAIEDVLTEVEMKWKEFLDLHNEWNSELCDKANNNQYASQIESGQINFKLLRQSIAEYIKSVKNNLRAIKGGQNKALDSWKSSFNEKYVQMEAFNNKFSSQPLNMDIAMATERKSVVEAYINELEIHNNLLTNLLNEYQNLLNNKRLSQAAEKEVKKDLAAIQALHNANKGSVDVYNNMISQEKETLKKKEESLYKKLMNKSQVVRDWISENQNDIDKYIQMPALIQHTEEVKPLVDEIFKHHSEVENILREGNFAQQSNHLSEESNESVNKVMIALATEWDDLTDAVNALEGKVVALKVEIADVDDFKNNIEMYNQFIVEKERCFNEICKKQDPLVALADTDSLLSELHNKDLELKGLRERHRELVNENELCEQSVSMVNSELHNFENHWQNLNEKVQDANLSLKIKCDQDNDIEQHALQEWSKKANQIEEWIQQAEHVSKTFSEPPENVEALQNVAKDYEVAMFKLSVQEEIIDEQLRYAEHLAASGTVKRNIVAMKDQIGDLTARKYAVDRVLSEQQSHIDGMLKELQEIEESEFVSWFEKAEAVKEVLLEFESLKPSENLSTIKDATNAVNKQKKIMEEMSNYAPEMDGLFVYGKSLINNKKLGKDRSAELTKELERIEQRWSSLHEKLPVLSEKYDQALSSLQKTSGNKVAGTSEKIKLFNNWLQFAKKQLDSDDNTGSISFPLMLQKEQGLKKLSADLDSRSSEYSDIVQTSQALITEMNENDVDSSEVEALSEQLQYGWSVVIDEIDAKFKNLYDDINCLLDKKRGQIDNTLQTVKDTLIEMNSSPDDCEVMKGNAVKLLFIKQSKLSSVSTIKELRSKLQNVIEPDMSKFCEGILAVKNLSIFTEEEKFGWDQCPDELQNDFKDCMSFWAQVMSNQCKDVVEYFGDQYSVIDDVLKMMADEKLIHDEDTNDLNCLSDFYLSEQTLLNQSGEQKLQLDQVDAELKGIININFLSNEEENSLNEMKINIRARIEEMSLSFEKKINRVHALIVYLIKEEHQKSKKSLSSVKMELELAKQKDIVELTNAIDAVSNLEKLTNDCLEKKSNLVELNKVINDLIDKDIVDGATSQKLQESSNHLLSEFNSLNTDLKDEEIRTNKISEEIQQVETSEFFIWFQKANIVKSKLDGFKDFEQEKDVKAIKETSFAESEQKEVLSDLTEYSTTVEELFDYGKSLITNKKLGKDKSAELSKELEWMQQRWASLNEKLPVILQRYQKTLKTLRQHSGGNLSIMVERLNDFNDWLQSMMKTHIEHSKTQSKKFQSLCQKDRNNEKLATDLTSRTKEYKNMILTSEDIISDMEKNDVNCNALKEALSVLITHWEKVNEIVSSENLRLHDEMSNNIKDSTDRIQNVMGYVQNHLVNIDPSLQDTSEMEHNVEIVMELNKELMQLQKSLDEHSEKIDLVNENTSFPNNVKQEYCDMQDMLLSDYKRCVQQVKHLRNCLSDNILDHFAENSGLIQDAIKELNHGKVLFKEDNYTLSELKDCYLCDQKILDLVENQKKLAERLNSDSNTLSKYGILSTDDQSLLQSYISKATKDIETLKSTSESRKERVGGLIQHYLKDGLLKTEKNLKDMKLQGDLVKTKEIKKYTHANASIQAFEELTIKEEQVSLQLCSLNDEFEDLLEKNILDESSVEKFRQKKSLLLDESKEYGTALKENLNKSTDRLKELEEFESTEFVQWFENAKPVENAFNEFELSTKEEDIKTIKDANEGVKKQREVVFGLTEYSTKVEELFDYGKSLITNKKLGKDKSAELSKELERMQQRWASLNERLPSVLLRYEQTLDSLHKYKDARVDTMIERMKHFNVWLCFAKSKVTDDKMKTSNVPFNQLMQTDKELNKLSDDLDSRSKEHNDIVKASETLITEMNENDVDSSEVEALFHQMQDDWSNVSMEIESGFSCLKCEVKSLLATNGDEIEEFLQLCNDTLSAIETSSNDKDVIHRNALELMNLGKDAEQIRKDLALFCKESDISSETELFTQEEASLLQSNKETIENDFDCFMEKFEESRHCVKKNAQEYVSDESALIKDAVDDLENKRLGLDEENLTLNDLKNCFISDKNALECLDKENKHVTDLSEFSNDISKCNLLDFAEQALLEDEINKASIGVKNSKMESEIRKNRVHALIQNVLKEDLKKSGEVLQDIKQQGSRVCAKEIKKYTHANASIQAFEELTIKEEQVSLQLCSLNDEFEDLLEKNILDESSVEKFRQKKSLLLDESKEYGTALKENLNKSTDRLKELEEFESTEFVQWFENAKPVENAFNEFELSTKEEDIKTIKDANEGVKKQREVVFGLTEYSTKVEELFDYGKSLITNKKLGKDKSAELSKELERMQQRWASLNERLPSVLLRYEQTLDSLHKYKDARVDTMIERMKHFNVWLCFAKSKVTDDKMKTSNVPFNQLMQTDKELNKLSDDLDSRSKEHNDIVKASETLITEMNENDVDSSEVEALFHQMQDDWSNVSMEIESGFSCLNREVKSLLATNGDEIEEFLQLCNDTLSAIETSSNDKDVIHRNALELMNLGKDAEQIRKDLALFCKESDISSETELFTQEEASLLQSNKETIENDFDCFMEKFEESRHCVKKNAQEYVSDESALIKDAVDDLENKRLGLDEENLTLNDLKNCFISDKNALECLDKENKHVTDLSEFSNDISKCILLDFAEQALLEDEINKASIGVKNSKMESEIRKNRVHALIQNVLKEDLKKSGEVLQDIKQQGSRVCAKEIKKYTHANASIQAFEELTIKEEQVSLQLCSLNDEFEDLLEKNILDESSVEKFRQKKSLLLDESKEYGTALKENLNKSTDRLKELEEFESTEFVQWFENAKQVENAFNEFELSTKEEDIKTIKDANEGVKKQREVVFGLTEYSTKVEELFDYGKSLITNKKLGKDKSAELSKELERMQQRWASLNERLPSVLLRYEQTLDSLHKYKDARVDTMIERIKHFNVWLCFAKSKVTDDKMKTSNVPFNQLMQTDKELNKLSDDLDSRSKEHNDIVKASETLITEMNENDVDSSEVEALFHQMQDDWSNVSMEIESGFSCLNREVKSLLATNGDEIEEFLQLCNDTLSAIETSSNDKDVIHRNALELMNLGKDAEQIRKDLALFCKESDISSETELFTQEEASLLQSNKETIENDFDCFMEKFEESRHCVKKNAQEYVSDESALIKDAVDDLENKRLGLDEENLTLNDLKNCFISDKNALECLDKENKHVTDLSEFSNDISKCNLLDFAEQALLEDEINKASIGVKNSKMESEIRKNRVHALIQNVLKEDLKKSGEVLQDIKQQGSRVCAKEIKKYTHANASIQAFEELTIKEEQVSLQLCSLNDEFEDLLEKNILDESSVEKFRQKKSLLLDESKEYGTALKENLNKSTDRLKELEEFESTEFVQWFENAKQVENAFNEFELSTKEEDIKTIKDANEGVKKQREVVFGLTEYSTKVEELFDYGKSLITNKKLGKDKSAELSKELERMQQRWASLNERLPSVLLRYEQTLDSLHKYKDARVDTMIERIKHFNVWLCFAKSKVTDDKMKTSNVPFNQLMQTDKELNKLSDDLDSRSKEHNDIVKASETLITEMNENDVDSSEVEALFHQMQDDWSNVSMKIESGFSCLKCEVKSLLATNGDEIEEFLQLCNDTLSAIETSSNDKDVIHRNALELMNLGKDAEQIRKDLALFCKESDISSETELFTQEEASLLQSNKETIENDFDCFMEKFEESRHCVKKNAQEYVSDESALIKDAVDDLENKRLGLDEENLTLNDLKNCFISDKNALECLDKENKHVTDLSEFSNDISKCNLLDFAEQALLEDEINKASIGVKNSKMESEIRKNRVHALIQNVLKEDLKKSGEVLQDIKQQGSRVCAKEIKKYTHANASIQAFEELTIKEEQVSLQLCSLNDEFEDLLEKNILDESSVEKFRQKKSLLLDESKEYGTALKENLNKSTDRLKELEEFESTEFVQWFENAKQVENAFNEFELSTKEEDIKTIKDANEGVKKQREVVFGLTEYSTKVEELFDYGKSLITNKKLGKDKSAELSKELERMQQRWASLNERLPSVLLRYEQTLDSLHKYKDARVDTMIERIKHFNVWLCFAKSKVTDDKMKTSNVPFNQLMQTDKELNKLSDDLDSRSKEHNDIVKASETLITEMNENDVDSSEVEALFHQMQDDWSNVSMEIESGFSCLNREVKSLLATNGDEIEEFLQLCNDTLSAIETSSNDKDVIHRNALELMNLGKDAEQIRKDLALFCKESDISSETELFTQEEASLLQSNKETIENDFDCFMEKFEESRHCVKKNAQEYVSDESALIKDAVDDLENKRLGLDEENLTLNDLKNCFISDKNALECLDKENKHVTDLSEFSNDISKCNLLDFAEQALLEDEINKASIGVKNSKMESEIRKNRVHALIQNVLKEDLKKFGEVLQDIKQQGSRVCAKEIKKYTHANASIQAFEELTIKEEQVSLQLCSLNDEFEDLLEKNILDESSVEKFRQKKSLLLDESKEYGTALKENLNKSTDRLKELEEFESTEFVQWFENAKPVENAFNEFELSTKEEDIKTIKDANEGVKKQREVVFGLTEYSTKVEELFDYGKSLITNKKLGKDKSAELSKELERMQQRWASLNERLPSVLLRYEQTLDSLHKYKDARVDTMIERMKHFNVWLCFAKSKVTDDKMKTSNVPFNQLMQTDKELNKLSDDLDSRSKEHNDIVKASETLITEMNENDVDSSEVEALFHQMQDDWSNVSMKIESGFSCLKCEVKSLLATNGDEIEEFLQLCNDTLSAIETSSNDKDVIHRNALELMNLGKDAEQIRKDLALFCKESDISSETELFTQEEASLLQSNKETIENDFDCFMEKFEESRHCVKKNAQEYVSDESALIKDAVDDLENKRLGLDEENLTLNDLKNCFISDKNALECLDKENKHVTDLSEFSNDISKCNLLDFAEQALLEDEINKASIGVKNSKMESEIRKNRVHALIQNVLKEDLKKSGEVLQDIKQQGSRVCAKEIKKYTHANASIQAFEELTIKEEQVSLQLCSLNDEFEDLLEKNILDESSVEKFRQKKSLLLDESKEYGTALKENLNKSTDRLKELEEFESTEFVQWFENAKQVENAFNEFELSTKEEDIKTIKDANEGVKKQREVVFGLTEYSTKVEELFDYGKSLITNKKLGKDKSAELSKELERMQQRWASLNERLPSVLLRYEQTLDSLHKYKDARVDTMIERIKHFNVWLCFAKSKVTDDKMKTSNVPFNQLMQTDKELNKLSDDLDSRSKEHNDIVKASETLITEMNENDVDSSEVEALFNQMQDDWSNVSMEIESGFSCLKCEVKSLLATNGDEIEEFLQLCNDTLSAIETSSNDKDVIHRNALELMNLGKDAEQIRKDLALFCKESDISSETELFTQKEASFLQSNKETIENDFDCFMEKFEESRHCVKKNAQEYVSDESALIKDAVDDLENKRLGLDEENLTLNDLKNCFISDKNALECLDKENKHVKDLSEFSNDISKCNLLDFAEQALLEEEINKASIGVKNSKMESEIRKNRVHALIQNVLKEDLKKSGEVLQNIKLQGSRVCAKEIKKYTHANASIQAFEELTIKEEQVSLQLCSLNDEFEDLLEKNILDESSVEKFRQKKSLLLDESKEYGTALKENLNKSTDRLKELEEFESTEFVQWFENAKQVENTFNEFELSTKEEDIKTIKDANEGVKKQREVVFGLTEYSTKVEELFDYGKSLITNKKLGKDKSAELSKELERMQQRWVSLNERLPSVLQRYERSMVALERIIAAKSVAAFEKISDFEELLSLFESHLQNAQNIECEAFSQYALKDKELLKISFDLQHREEKFSTIAAVSEKLIDEMEHNDIDFNQIKSCNNNLKDHWLCVCGMLKTERECLHKDMLVYFESVKSDLHERLQQLKLDVPKSLITKNPTSLIQNLSFVTELDEDLSKIQEPVISLHEQTLMLNKIEIFSKKEKVLLQQDCLDLKNDVMDTLQAIEHIKIELRCDVMDYIKDELAKILDQVEKLNNERQTYIEDSIEVDELKGFFLSEQATVGDLEQESHCILSLEEFIEQLSPYNVFTVENQKQAGKLVSEAKHDIETLKKDCAANKTSVRMLIQHILKEEAQRIDDQIKSVADRVDSVQNTDVNEIKDASESLQTVNELSENHRNISSSLKVFKVQLESLSDDNVFDIPTAQRLHEKLNELFSKTSKLHDRLSKQETRNHEDLAALQKVESTEFVQWFKNAKQVENAFNEFELSTKEKDLKTIKDANEGVINQKEVLSDLTEYSTKVEELFDYGKSLITNKKLGKDKSAELSKELERMQQSWASLNERLPSVLQRYMQTLDSLQILMGNKTDFSVDRVKHFNDWLKATTLQVEPVEDNNSSTTSFQNLVQRYYDLQKLSADLDSRAVELSDIMSASEKLLDEMSSNNLHSDDIERIYDTLQSDWNNLVDCFDNRHKTLYEQFLSFFDDEKADLQKSLQSVKKSMKKFTQSAQDNAAMKGHARALTELSNVLSRLEGPVLKLSEEMSSLSDVTLFLDEEKLMLQQASGDIVKEYKQCVGLVMQAKISNWDAILKYFNESANVAKEEAELLNENRLTYEEGNVSVDDLKSYYLAEKELLVSFQDQSCSIQKLQPFAEEISVDGVLSNDEQLLLAEIINGPLKDVDGLAKDCEARKNRVHALILHLLNEKLQKNSESLAKMKKKLAVSPNQSDFNEFSLAESMLKDAKGDKEKLKEVSHDLALLEKQLQDFVADGVLDKQTAEKFLEQLKLLLEESTKCSAKQTKEKETLKKDIRNFVLNKLDLFWGWLPNMQKRSSEGNKIGPDLSAMKKQLLEMKIIEQQTNEHSFRGILEDDQHTIGELLSEDELAEINSANDDWLVIRQWCSKRKQALENSVNKWEEFKRNEADLQDYLREKQKESSMWNQTDLNDGDSVEKKKKILTNVVSGMETRRTHVITFNNLADQLIALIGEEESEVNNVLSWVADVHELWNKVVKQSIENISKIEKARESLIELEQAIDDVSEWVTLTSSLLAVVDEDMDNAQLEALLTEIKEKDSEQVKVKERLDLANRLYTELANNNDTRSHFSVKQNVTELNEEFERVVKEVENLNNLRGQGKILWRRLKGNLNSAADVTSEKMNTAKEGSKNFFDRVFTSVFRRAESKEEAKMTAQSSETS